MGHLILVPGNNETLIYILCLCSNKQSPLCPPAYTPQSPAPQYQQQSSVNNSGRGAYGQPMSSAVSQPQLQQQQQQQQPFNYRQQSPASGMVTLRQSTPISQKPTPVYQSQPPVSSFNGEEASGSWSN